MAELTHGPRTIAKRIVTELQRRGIVQFGSASVEAERLIADILIEEFNRPSIQEFAEQCREFRKPKP